MKENIEPMGFTAEINGKIFRYTWDDECKRWLIDGKQVMNMPPMFPFLDGGII